MRWISQIINFKSNKLKPIDTFDSHILLYWERVLMNPLFHPNKLKHFNVSLQPLKVLGLLTLVSFKHLQVLQYNIVLCFC